MNSKDSAIRRLAVEIVSLVADRVTPAAFHPVVIVIQHFLERPFVNDRLVALETWPLFSLERFDRHGAELDSFHGLPRFLVALQDLDAVKPGVA